MTTDTPPKEFRPEGEGSFEMLPPSLNPQKGDTPKITELKINTTYAIYRYVILVLGIVIVLVILVSGALLLIRPDVAIPDGLIAIGSAAVGAIAGILAQSPSGSTETQK
jgi:hypothetical protein